MGCAVCRQSAVLSFELPETEGLVQSSPPVPSSPSSPSSLASSSRLLQSAHRQNEDDEYELREDSPNLFITPFLLHHIRHSISSLSHHSLHSSAYNKIVKYAKKVFLNNKLSDFKPYCGKDKDKFLQQAQVSFNSMLYLAVVGAISSDRAYLETSKHILMCWAMAYPSPGVKLEDESHPSRRLTATGLTISRFLDRIIESYRILSATLTTSETFFVKRWLVGLGGAIKASHKFWLEKYRIEGPQNHMSWHVFGMTAVGVFTDDQALIKYALSRTSGEAKGDSNHWSFESIVSAAIYVKKRNNTFRSGCNPEGKVYAFDKHAEDGEIWDRYRTLDPNKAAGMAYSLFNLRALVFTAHIAERNQHLMPGMTSFRGDDGDTRLTAMDWSGGALSQALHFYGQYFIEFPVDTPAHINCAPYKDQAPLYEDLAEFLVAGYHFPEDDAIRVVLEKNLIKNPKSKLQKESTDRPQQERNSDGKRPSLVFSQHPEHPLNTPVSYLTLVLGPSDFNPSR